MNEQQFRELLHASVEELKEARAENERLRIADAAELGRLRRDNLRLIETVERQQAELKTLHDALCMDTILDDDHNQG
jgi:hypothetical protein